MDTAPQLKLDRRTGFGTRGRGYELMVNCFKVIRQPENNIQHYDVAFDDKEFKEKRDAMRVLIEQKKIFGDEGVRVVYDGVANLYMSSAQVRSERVFEISEAEARGRPPRNDRPNQKMLHIKITHAATINMGELAAYIIGRAEANGNILQAINALNVAIKYGPSCMFPSRKNNFFPFPSDQQKREISGGLEVWRGYFSSIRPGISQLYLNFDTAVGCFKQAGSLINVCLKVAGRRDPRDLVLSRLPPREKLKLTRFIKKTQVKLSVSRDPKAQYKIRKVSEQSADEFKFEQEPGKWISVRQYIEQKYQIRLQHPYLPCAQLTKIAWYPLEMLSILPGCIWLTKLTPDQVGEILKVASLKPNDKLNAMKEGMKHLQLGGANMTLRAWSYDVEPRPLSVKARLLEPPPVNYTDNRGQPSPLQPRDGAWDIRGGKRGTRPGRKIERWCVCVFADDAPSRDGFPLPEVQNAVTQFASACSSFGIQFANQRPSILHVGAQTMDVRSALTNCAKKAGFTAKTPPELVLTLLLSRQSRQYSTIKLECDVKLGWASQNLLVQKLRNAKSQYYQNVALKVNVKLNGGVNQTIRGMPGMDKPTLIFGADVTHPGPGSFLPSIAAVVGSHDQWAASYTTAVRAQNSREEIIIELEAMAIELIKNFRVKLSGKKPERLIFYRDGVSEGQFDEVCRKEIAAIKRACNTLGGANFNPPLTYIICGKRHHIRFYPKSPSDGDRSGNAKAGTVVDGDITHPFWNDFYCLSHAGLLGTSRPAHYTVLLDESKFGPDDLQALTYHLTHLYARSTRSVSIATPAYYAHHVAARARMHVGDDDEGSVISGKDDEAQDAYRNEKLEQARQALQGVHANIQSTMYFM